MPALSVRDQIITSGLAERIASFHEGGDLFLPTPFLQNIVLPRIVASCVALLLLYVTLLQFVGRVLSSNADLRQKRKVCYQITNFIANLILAVGGNYYFLLYVHPDATVEEKTQGNEQFVFLSCFQIGYQLWAIPVGIWYVNESAAMLTHHVTVILVALMSAFMRNGFRYWTPFFYGVIETSSVPLSIMNFFKENPSYAKQYPTFNTAIRVIFALSFLTYRIFMFVPRMKEFLTHHYLLFSVYPSLPYRIFMSGVFLSSFFLQVLQIYWACLILKGLFKLAFVHPKKNKTV